MPILPFIKSKELIIFMKFSNNSRNGSRIHEERKKDDDVLKRHSCLVCLLRINFYPYLCLIHMV